VTDYRRERWRSIRKAVGLPASKDVGTLSVIIAALRAKAEEFVGEPVSAVAISIPHLNALYGEDLNDACEHILLYWQEDDNPTVYNFEATYKTKALYVNSGYALCKDYKNITACHEEEHDLDQIPNRYLWAVDYTDTSLFSGGSRAQAYALEESEASEDSMHLGLTDRHQDHYWTKVDEKLSSSMYYGGLERNVSLVLLSGDAADNPKFREVLNEMIDYVLESEPERVFQDPEFSAAKGMAELAKRDLFRRKQAHKENGRPDL
jgi:hypothetical protein